MNKVFVKTSAYVMTAIILLMSFAVPAYASYEDLPIVPVFSSYLFNEARYNASLDAGYAYYDQQGTLLVPVHIYAVSDGTQAVRYGFVKSRQYNNEYALIGIVKEQVSGSLMGISYYNNQYGSINVSGAFLRHAQTDYWITGEIRITNNPNMYAGLFSGAAIPSNMKFDSLDDLIESYEQDPVVSQTLNYSLPAGNAIVIELGQGSNPYQISTTAINPGPVDGTGLGGKQWGFYNSLPSTIEYPLSGAYNIAFRGYGSTSVLGQYMTYSISGDFVLENHSEKYLIIVNPLWAYTSDGDVTNSRIDISIDKVNSFRVYPLGTQLVNGGWTSQNEGEYLDGNYDENTNTWYTTDEDGNIVESQVGGYNYVDYGPQNVMQWLENIAHQISGFFTGAIGAINTLVGAISNFSSTLMSLYIWLPPAVQGILTSAIILAITIGVIKVFI